MQCYVRFRYSKIKCTIVNQNGEAEVHRVFRLLYTSSDKHVIKQPFQFKNTINVSHKKLRHFIAHEVVDTDEVD